MRLSWKIAFLNASFEKQGLQKKVICFLHQAFCTTMHWTPVTTCIGLSIAPEEKHVSSSNLHLLGTLLFLITWFSVLYNINNRTVLNSLLNPCFKYTVFTSLLNTKTRVTSRHTEKFKGYRLNLWTCSCFRNVASVEQWRHREIDLLSSFAKQ